MSALHVTAVASKGRSTKGERTRERILEAALALFRDKGFDKTTMRDVARASDMSLGAAYYYFASKEAIVLAYYRQVFATRATNVRVVFSQTDDLSTRVRAMYHQHFDALRRDRQLVGALVRSVADPQSDISTFSAATREVRNGSIELFHEAISVDAVPEQLRDLGALGLWTLDLALTLYFVWDTSARQAKTRKLADDTLDMLLAVIPLLALPMATPMIQRLAKVLIDAGLVPDDACRGT